MKTWMLCMSLLLSGVTLAPRDAGADPSDEAAVHKPLEALLQGHSTGKVESLQQAYWPDARLTFVRDGAVQVMSIDEHFKRFADHYRSPAGKPRPDAGAWHRDIRAVQVLGTMAVATVVEDGPESRYTSYLTLLQVKGEWRIINKSFHEERKAPVLKAAP
ncbi:nuclear transport factor 2 family protein [Myxococcaceae bacterium JPH2]|nr:nuclear transport factor 2 family protein [Myxococcaceae bacterium JPH2]